MKTGLDKNRIGLKALDQNRLDENRLDENWPHGKLHITEWHHIILNTNISNIKCWVLIGYTVKIFFSSKCILGIWF